MIGGNRKSGRKRTPTPKVRRDADTTGDDDSTAALGRVARAEAEARRDADADADAANDADDAANEGRADDPPPQKQKKGTPKLRQLKIPSRKRGDSITTAALGAGARADDLPQKKKKKKSTPTNPTPAATASNTSGRSKSSPSSSGEGGGGGGGGGTGCTERAGEKTESDAAIAQMLAEDEINVEAE